MSGNIDTREFSINDYDAAIKLWQRVEGLEIAEGDDRESVAQFLARNPALSRVATDGSGTVGVALCGHDDAGDLCPAAALPEFTAARIMSATMIMTRLTPIRRRPSKHSSTRRIPSPRP
jgi:hypothetical protein